MMWYSEVKFYADETDLMDMNNTCIEGKPSTLITPTLNLVLIGNLVWMRLTYRCIH